MVQEITGTAVQNIKTEKDQYFQMLLMLSWSSISNKVIEELTEPEIPPTGNKPTVYPLVPVREI